MIVSGVFTQPEGRKGKFKPRHYRWVASVATVICRMRSRGWRRNSIATVSRWGASIFSGNPAEIVRRQRGNRGIVETASGFRRRQGRVGPDPAVGEFPAIVGGNGKIAPGREGRIERCGFDRIGEGELRDRDLARRRVATFGFTVQLLRQLLHRLVLPTVSQPAFDRRDVCRGGQAPRGVD